MVQLLKFHKKQIDKGGLKLCHFETKVKALKLYWVKRLVSEKDYSTKTILQLPQSKYIFQCKPQLAIK